MNEDTVMIIGRCRGASNGVLLVTVIQYHDTSRNPILKGSFKGNITL
jgi:hypothetical protein